MKKIFIGVSIVLFLAGIAMAAGEGGTQDEAKALVEKAVALIKSEGQEKAFDAFNDPKGEFVKKDLYIFVLNMEGTVLAHGANSGLIGKNLMELKDADKKPFIEEMIEKAKQSPEGWVDYKWTNPVTNTVQQKSTYYQKIEDILVCCGVYK